MPMSRLPVAEFVESFFTRMLFQPDDGIASKTVELELSPSAEIAINTNPLPSALFFQTVVLPFRTSQIGSILSVQDLTVVPSKSGGSSSSGEGDTGLVAQYTVFEITPKDGNGATKRQAVTTIARVENKQEGGGASGERWITGIWQIMGDVQE